MRFISFLICSSLFTLAAPLCNGKFEEMTPSIYEQSGKRLTALFQTGGDAAESSNLRTEAVGRFQPATAHVSFFRDASCTELTYIIDDKINRCSSLLGGAMATIIGENKSSWRVKVQAYDSSCNNALSTQSIVREFKKNTCMEFNGAYITINMIDAPQNKIAGGGTALVFYDKVSDCTMSKNTNLARVTAMLTFPTKNCNNVFGGVIVRAEICSRSQSDRVGFSFWKPAADHCMSENYLSNSGVINVNDNFCAFSSSSSSSSRGLSVPPVRLLCIGDNSLDEEEIGIGEQM
jgi:hypothetical protein